MKGRSVNQWLGILAVLGAVALPACNNAKGEGQTEAQGDAAAGDSAGGGGSSVSLPVVGAEVRKGDLVIYVNTRGQIRSEATATLKSEANGTIVALNVRPGQRVAKGDTLLKVDPQPLQIAIDEALARVERAKLTLLDLTLPDSLVTGKAVTGERRRAAEVRADIDGANAALARARLEYAKATLIAPFDGVMDEIKVSLGDRISTGQEVGKLVDLMNLRIDASVLEHELPLLKIGGEVTITASASDDPIRGRVSAILPLVDSASRAGRALIALKGNGILRPGMYADVRLEANRMTNRIVVPAAALIERDGRPLVFVLKNDHAMWQYVTPGRTNGYETEILPDSASGQIPIQPGDIVLVEGHLTLTHNAPVRLAAKQERGTR